MAYSNFTLAEVVTTFQLEIVESEDLFAEVAPVPPSAHLTTTLERNVPLATAINTEKAKSELIVAQVLVELREHFNRRISLFSGVDFSIDDENGLVGVCDFLVSLSPLQSLLEAPIVTLVEAKKDDLALGRGQCAAEMVAAQRFNAQRGNDIPRVYGATTTGREWQFLKLAERELQIDLKVYPIQQCDKILGILASMVKQQA